MSRLGPTALLLVVALAALLDTAVAAGSQVPPATPCAAAVVSFSPCLAHVAVVAPPAQAAPVPSDACCAAFLRAVFTSDGEGGGGEGCFCHLLRDPVLLGFPVDAARIGALLPICAAANASAAATIEAETLFAEKCRELKSLPEMHFKSESPPTPKISPDVVPEPAPVTTTEPLSTSVLHDRPVSKTFCTCKISLATLMLATAAAAAITLEF